MDTNISFTLKVWRQKGPQEKGHFDTFEMKDIPGDTSFLEMLDILNEQISSKTSKSPLSLTTIAARVYAVCARCISTVIPTDRHREPPHVSFTCAVSTMAMS